MSDAQESSLVLQVCEFDSVSVSVQVFVTVNVSAYF